MSGKAADVDAWDFVDEGPETVIGRLRAAGVDKRYRQGLFPRERHYLPRPRLRPLSPPAAEPRDLPAPCGLAVDAGVAGC